MNAFPVGSTTAAPLYKAVQDQIVTSLAQGEWKPGEAIPSEAQLAKRYNVSIGTLRKAIDDLVATSILIRHQGRGTFVAVHDYSRNLYHFFHIVGSDGVKHYPDIELTSFTRCRAPTRVARALKLEPKQGIFKIINVLTLQGQPVVIDEIAVPQRLFPTLTRQIVQHRNTTMYGLYQAHFGINVVHTKERLRARRAHGKTADLLELAQQSPILEIERVAYTYNEQPVESRISHVDTTEHDYLNDLV